MVDDVTPSPGPPPVAPVPPYVAAVLLREVSSQRWRELIEGARMTNPELARQLEQAGEYLRHGREWWKDQVRAATSARGSAEVESAEATPDSDHPSSWDSVRMVADTLGLTPRRIRQMCGVSLRAKKVGKVWIIDHDAVEEYSMRPSE